VDIVGEGCTVLVAAADEAGWADLARSPLVVDTCHTRAPRRSAPRGSGELGVGAKAQEAGGITSRGSRAVSRCAGSRCDQVVVGERREQRSVVVRGVCACVHPPRSETAGRVLAGRRHSPHTGHGGPTQPGGALCHARLRSTCAACRTWVPEAVLPSRIWYRSRIWLLMSSSSAWATPLRFHHGPALGSLWISLLRNLDARCTTATAILGASYCRLSSVRRLQRERERERESEGEREGERDRGGEMLEQGPHEHEGPSGTDTRESTDPSSRIQLQRERR
jgi:hypothetical protein